MHGFNVSTQDGGMFFGERIDATLEMYEIGDLIEGLDEDEREEYIDHFDSLLRDDVDPHSWDEHPHLMATYWQDLLLVVQSPEAHGQIEALLSALRRAHTR